MVSALIGSGKLSLPAWEPHVTSKATQAQSFERRWRRFLTNKKINIEHIVIPNKNETKTAKIDSK